MKYIFCGKKKKKERKKPKKKQRKIKKKGRGECDRVNCVGLRIWRTVEIALKWKN